MEDLIRVTAGAVFELVTGGVFSYALAVVVPMGAFGLAYRLMLGRLQRK